MKYGKDMFCNIRKDIRHYLRYKLGPRGHSCGRKVSALKRVITNINN